MLRIPYALVMGFAILMPLTTSSGRRPTQSKRWLGGGFTFDEKAVCVFLFLIFVCCTLFGLSFVNR